MIEDNKPNQRRVVRVAVTTIETDYDYEGNAYEYAYERELVETWDGNSLLWKGEEGEAHGLCLNASSQWLPSGQLTDSEQTKNDALWSLVAPYADRVFASHHLSFEQDSHPVAELGSNDAVHIPGHCSVNLRTNGHSPERSGWLLAIDGGKRTLAQQTHRVFMDGDFSILSVSGVYVSEPGI